MEYLIRNRPHATQTIIKLSFCDDTYAVVNIDNKGPKNFTQHPSVIFLIPPKKKNFAKAKLVELSKKWTWDRWFYHYQNFFHYQILFPMALHCESFVCRTAPLLPAVFFVPTPPLQGATGVVLWNTCRSEEYTFID